MSRWAEEVNKACSYLTDAGIKKMLVHRLIDPRYRPLHLPLGKWEAAKRDYVPVSRFDNEKQTLVNLSAFTMTQLFLVWIILLAGIATSAVAFAVEKQVVGAQRKDKPSEPKSGPRNNAWMPIRRGHLNH